MLPTVALLPGHIKPERAVPVAKKPGPDILRQAVLLGTTKLFGVETIVPLVVANTTLVPTGMMLPLTSVIVTRTSRVSGVNTVFGSVASHGAKTIPVAGFIGFFAESKNRTTASDPENTIGKLRRTWMD